MPFTFDDLIRAHYLQFQELSVSPDDREVLAVFGTHDMPDEDYAHDERDRSIWRISLADGSCVQLTQPEEDSRLPAWSPDGKQIAFVSRCSGKNEVWVMNRDGSGRRQVTQSDFPARNPYQVKLFPVNEVALWWSPDGTKLAYSALPRGSLYSIMRESDPFDNALKTGKIVVLKDNERYSHVWSEADAMIEGAIYVADLSTGEARCVASVTDGAFRLFGWTPDGKRLIAALKEDLLEIDLATGDRRTIFTGAMTLVVMDGSDIFTVHQAEKKVEIRQVEYGSSAEVASVDMPEEFRLRAMTRDRRRLLGTVQEGVTIYLVSVDTHTSSARKLTEPGWCAMRQDLPGPIACLNRESSAVFPYTSPTEPAELWKCGPDGSISKVSKLFDGLDRSSLGQVRVVRYESDGWNIEALLVLPPDYDPGKKYPTLVYPQGGPEACVTANFTDLISARAQSLAHWLAARGYVIFMPNFRGKSGYGEAFKNELSDFRLLRTPYADVMAGADYLIAEGIADPDSLGVYGSSFGGWLTAWTVTQTDRFKCAAPAVGVYDALALDRLVGRPFWSLTPNRQGKADPMDLWRRPEVYREISPIEHVASVKTPTLLIETGGERRPGYWGGRSFWLALCALGVETYYVWYPRAEHNGGWNDEYKKDYARRLLAWFDHYLKGSPLPDWFYPHE
jgi:dipeptidyl aminopeptidase/acylaminoacyl peptidase